MSHVRWIPQTSEPRKHTEVFEGVGQTALCCEKTHWRRREIAESHGKRFSSIFRLPEKHQGTEQITMSKRRPVCLSPNTDVWHACPYMCPPLKGVGEGREGTEFMAWLWHTSWLSVLRKSSLESPEHRNCWHLEMKCLPNTHELWRHGECWNCRR